MPLQQPKLLKPPQQPKLLKPPRTTEVAEATATTKVAEATATTKVAEATATTKVAEATATTKVAEAPATTKVAEATGATKVAEATGATKVVMQVKSENVLKIEKKNIESTERDVKIIEKGCTSNSEVKDVSQIDDIDFTNVQRESVMRVERENGLKFEGRSSFNDAEDCSSDVKTSFMITEDSSEFTKSASQKVRTSREIIEDITTETYLIKVPVTASGQGTKCLSSKIVNVAMPEDSKYKALYDISSLSMLPVGYTCDTIKEDVQSESLDTTRTTKFEIPKNSTICLDSNNKASSSECLSIYFASDPTMISSSNISVSKEKNIIKPTFFQSTAESATISPVCKSVPNLSKSTASTKHESSSFELKCNADASSSGGLSTTVSETSGSAGETFTIVSTSSMRFLPAVSGKLSFAPFTDSCCYSSKSSGCSSSLSSKQVTHFSDGKTELVEGQLLLPLSCENIVTKDCLREINSTRRSINKDEIYSSNGAFVSPHVQSIEKLQSHLASSSQTSGLTIIEPKQGSSHVLRSTSPSVVKSVSKVICWPPEESENLDEHKSNRHWSQTVSFTAIKEQLRSNDELDLLKEQKSSTAESDLADPESSLVSDNPLTLLGKDDGRTTSSVIYFEPEVQNSVKTDSDAFAGTVESSLIEVKDESGSCSETVDESDTLQRKKVHFVGVDGSQDLGSTNVKQMVTTFCVEQKDISRNFPTITRIEQTTVEENDCTGVISATKEDESSGHRSSREIYEFNVKQWKDYMDARATGKLTTDAILPKKNRGVPVLPASFNTNIIETVKLKSTGIDLRSAPWETKPEAAFVSKEEIEVTDGNEEFKNEIKMTATAERNEWVSEEKSRRSK